MKCLSEVVAADPSILARVSELLWCAVVTTAKVQHRGSFTEPLSGGVGYRE